jgi:hypothetical protein
MPSSWTFSLRFEKQGVGENLNTWGVRLNNALERIDKAIAGATPIAMTGGVYTLSTANATDDEARSAILLLTGTGGTLVIPPVSKLYTMRNAGNAPVLVTTGAGETATVRPGDTTQVMCDGAGCTTPKIAGLDVKQYVDAQAWNGMTGTLPGQLGAANHILRTDGTNPYWHLPTTAMLADITTYTRAREALALAFAVAL